MNEPDEPTRYLFARPCDEEDVIDLAAGLVPKWMQADARTMLDSEDRIRRNAERPVRQRRKQA